MKNGNGTSVASAVLALSEPATPVYSRGVPLETSPQLDRDLLRTWLRDKADPKHKSRQCVLFQLSHDRGGEGGRDSGLRVLGVVGRVVPKKVGAAELDDIVSGLVEELAEQSRVHAWTFPRPQRFEVGGLLSEDPNAAPEYVFSFLVTPPPEVASAFHQTSDDGTNVPALVGHLQRLLDTTIRGAMSNSQSDKDRLVEEKGQLMKYHNELMKTCYEQSKEMQQLLDAQKLRNIQEHRERMILDAQSKAIDAAMKYGGAAIDKWLADGKGEHPLMTFAKTLSPAQLAPFIGSLTEEQQKVFLPMGRQLIGDMSEEQKAEVGRLLLEDQDKRDRAKKEGQS